MIVEEVATRAARDQALTALVQPRGTELKRYGYLLCGDRGEAEDLVRDALVRTFTFSLLRRDPGGAVRP
jgi:DNA-directed RNA polymerase specialized sigma24 family protein